MSANKLNVVLIRPTNYNEHGYVARSGWTFMPSSALIHIKSLTPPRIGECDITVTTIDEHTQVDLSYLEDFKRKSGSETLVACVAVQSREFQRALDLCAFAKEHGAHAVIGGPHAMSCFTTEFHGRGVSFALAEAEEAWLPILNDVIHGGLEPVYGKGQRLAKTLNSPVLIPPSSQALRRKFGIIGIASARGCPRNCTYCSVPEIAGSRLRSESVDTIIKSLQAAKKAGARMIMFTADNANLDPTFKELMIAMSDEKINLPFFVQCEATIERQGSLVELMAKAGCWQIFIGAESFDRATLLAHGKSQNNPEKYGEILRLFREYKILAHFSNMIGFENQTEKDILEHLDKLLCIGPEVASFYILTPVPGTPDCELFLDNDLITQPANLDRFDGTWCVWEHPHIAKERLRELEFYCYQKFFEFRRTCRTICQRLETKMPLVQRILESGYLFYALAASHFNQHPMSGGIVSRRIDSVKDYIHLRKKYFDVELVTVPRRRPPSEADKNFIRSSRLLLQPQPIGA